MSGSGVIVRKMATDKWQLLDAELAGILSQFDKAQEWADLATCLQKLTKALQRPPTDPHEPLPRILPISRVLYNCLNPQLPSGIHSKTLKVYECILDRVGPVGLPVCLQLLLPPIINVYGYASNANRLHVCNIYQEFLVPCLDELKPLSLMIVAAVILGVENDKSAEFGVLSSFLNLCEKAWGRSFAFKTLWQVVAEYEEGRGAALKLLGRRHEQLGPSSLSDSFAFPDQVIKASYFCGLPAASVGTSNRNRESFLKDARQFLDNVGAGLTYIDLAGLKILLGNLSLLLALDDVSVNFRLRNLMQEYKISFAMVISEIFQAVYTLTFGKDGRDHGEIMRAYAPALLAWSKNMIGCSQLILCAKIYSVIVRLHVTDSSPVLEDLAAYNAWPLYLALGVVVDQEEWELLHALLPPLEVGGPETSAQQRLRLADSELPLHIQSGDPPQINFLKSADVASPVRLNVYSNRMLLASRWQAWALESLAIAMQSYERRKGFPLDVAAKLLIVAGFSSDAEARNLWDQVYVHVYENRADAGLQEALDEVQVLLTEQDNLESHWPEWRVCAHPTDRQMRQAERLCALGNRNLAARLLELEGNSSVWVAATGFKCYDQRCAEPVSSADVGDGGHRSLSENEAPAQTPLCVCLEDQLITCLLQSWACGRELPPTKFVADRIGRIAEAATTCAQDGTLNCGEEDLALLHNTLWTHGLHSLEGLVEQILIISREQIENSLSLIARGSKKSNSSPSSDGAGNVRDQELILLTQRYKKLVRKLSSFTLAMPRLPLIMSNTRALVHIIPFVALIRGGDKLPGLVMSMPEHTVQALWSLPAVSPVIATNGYAWSCLHHATNELVAVQLGRAVEAGDTPSVGRIIQAVDHLAITAVSGEMLSLYAEQLSECALQANYLGQFELVSLILNLILKLLSNTQFSEAPVSPLSCHAASAQAKGGVGLVDYEEGTEVQPGAAIQDNAQRGIQTFLAECKAINACEQTRVEEAYRLLQPIFTCLFQAMDTTKATDPASAAATQSRRSSAGAMAHNRERVALIPALKILAFLADRSASVRLQFARLLVRTFNSSSTPRVQRNILLHLDSLVKNMPQSADAVIDISVYEPFPWVVSFINRKHGIHESTRYKTDMENLYLSCLNSQFFSITNDERLRIYREQFLSTMLRKYEKSTFMTLSTIWMTAALTQQIEDSRIFETIRASGVLSLERAWALAAEVLTESKACSVYGFLQYFTLQCTTDGSATSPPALWKYLDTIASNTEPNAYGAVSWISELTVTLAKYFSCPGLNIDRISKLLVDSLVSQKKPLQDLVPPFPASMLRFERATYATLGMPLPERYVTMVGRVLGISVEEIDDCDQVGTKLKSNAPRPPNQVAKICDACEEQNKPCDCQPGILGSSGPNELSCDTTSTTDRWGDKIVCVKKVMMINQAECAQQVAVHSFGALVSCLTKLDTNSGESVLAHFLNSAALGTWVAHVCCAKPSYSISVYSMSRVWLLLNLWSMDRTCLGRCASGLTRAKCLGRVVRPTGSRLRAQVELTMLNVCVQHVARALGSLGSMKGYRSVFARCDKGGLSDYIDEREIARSFLEQTWVNSVGSVLECEPLQATSIFSSRATEVKNKADYLYRLGAIALSLPAQVLLRGEALWLAMLTDLRKTTPDTKIDLAVLYILKVLLLRIGGYLPRSSALWAFANTRICELWLPILAPIMVQGSDTPVLVVEDTLIIAGLQLIEVASLFQPPMIAIYFAEKGPLRLLWQKLSGGAEAPMEALGVRGRCGQVAVPYGVTQVAAACSALYTKGCGADCAVCQQALMNQLHQEFMRTFLISLEQK